MRDRSRFEDMKKNERGDRGKGVVDSEDRRA